MENMKAAYSGHERIDQRSIALHSAIAEKLAANPELLQIARDNLIHLTQKRGRSQPYWDAWTELIARPLPELLQQLTEDSERMRALRQATPFAGVLSPSERWAIYDRFKMASLLS